MREAEEALSLLGCLCLIYLPQPVKAEASKRQENWVLNCLRSSSLAHGGSKVSKVEDG